MTKNIARTIIQRAFDAGYPVSVDDGDGPVNYKTLTGAWNAIRSVEVADVYIKPPDRDRPEWMLVIPDLDPDETAANFTADGWIDATWKEEFKG
jgi:hypothetical protein